MMPTDCIIRIKSYKSQNRPQATESAGTHLLLLRIWLWIFIQHLIALHVVKCLYCPLAALAEDLLIHSVKREINNLSVRTLITTV